MLHGMGWQTEASSHSPKAHVATPVGSYPDWQPNVYVPPLAVPAPPAVAPAVAMWSVPYAVAHGAGTQVGEVGQWPVASQIMVADPAPPSTTYPDAHSNEHAGARETTPPGQLVAPAVVPEPTVVIAAHVFSMAHVSPWYPLKHVQVQL